jgi:hypothetical protein
MNGSVANATFLALLDWPTSVGRVSPLSPCGWRRRRRGTSGDGSYYVSSRLETLRAFRFYSFVTKKSVEVAAAPPDRRRLVYCADTEANADLVLFELK